MSPVSIPCCLGKGPQYQGYTGRLVFIAGRKLNEDSDIVKTFSEIFSRVVIVPNREIPPETDDETPGQKGAS